jgi:hypothetical protein
MALVVAPVRGEARDCCSNSARISGSTVEKGIRWLAIIKRKAHHSLCIGRDSVENKRSKDVLFSISLGIPRVRARATIAIRIIGFLTRLSGETIFPKTKELAN